MPRGFKSGQLRTHQGGSSMRSVRFGLLAFWVFSCGAASGWAQFELLGKAQPDEFFNGVGQPYVPWGQQGEDDEGQAKVNQDYLWGLAADGPMVWFGTGGNAAGMAAGQVQAGISDPEPSLTVSGNGVPCRVWEFGASQYPGIPDALRTFLGDWRPPRIYQYNSESGQLIDRTPNDSRLQTTLGLRSAGAANGVVLLAGPSLYQVGVNIFAFDSQSGKYLGSKYLFEYSNIRRWININGQLYTSALNSYQGRVRGSVLRWRGNRWFPFLFEHVGSLDNEGSYLAYHDGRLFVGTWPTVSLLTSLIQGFDTQPPPCALWMSPPIPSGGLNVFHAHRWSKVWDPSEYEPDPAILRGYAFGAMESYGGSLYWGMIQFPYQGLKSFYAHHGFLPDEDDYLLTERTPLVVRATGYGSNDEPDVEYLYADQFMYVFTPDGEGSGTWAPQANVTGAAGIYGSGAFGEVYNRYVWSSAVHNGKLYFGTFDVRSLGNIGQIVDGTASAVIGADVWVFNSPGTPATALTRNGGGNQANHGFRNMVSTPHGLYLGTANSANLLTHDDEMLPRGGWEFLRLLE